MSPYVYLPDYRLHANEILGFLHFMIAVLSEHFILFFTICISQTDIKGETTTETDI